MRTNLRASGTLVGIIVAVLLFIILFLTFSVKVPVWYTAISVDVYGKNVVPKWLHTGRNFINPITHDYFKYPIFIQQTEYNRLRFQDKSWLLVVADIGMDYKFDEEKIGTMYENYKAWVRKITNDYMRTWVKNAVNRASAEFEVDALYGQDKEKFRQLVLTNLQNDLGSKWILVNNVYFTWDMELPEAVKGRINAKIEATQTAMQKENELRATKADAAKRIAEAEWVATSAVVRSKWLAEAKIIEAEAISKANRLINSSITNTLIEYNKAKSWDWVLPSTVAGWVTPFLNIK